MVYYPNLKHSYPRPHRADLSVQPWKTRSDRRITSDVLSLVEPNTTKFGNSEEGVASASHGSEAMCDGIHAEPFSLSNAMLCWALCSMSEAEYGASHSVTQRAGCGRQPYCFTQFFTALDAESWVSSLRAIAQTAQRTSAKALVLAINVRTEAHTARICQSTIDGKGAAAPPSFSISPVLGWLLVSTSTGWNTKCS
jgi:hypothetical protein